MIDPQNDFVTGVLGTKEARAAAKNIQTKLDNNSDQYEMIFFTRDVHFYDNYEKQQEYQLLKIQHCMSGSWGAALAVYSNRAHEFFKGEFGSIHFADLIKFCITNEFDNCELEICGFCTDICVIMNAMLIKAELPEIKITIDSSCCAGSTPENHEAALKVLKACQFYVI